MLSLRKAIELICPQGTSEEVLIALGQDSSFIAPVDQVCWEAPPIFPPDMFAICSYLLDVGGAYHWIVAAAEGDSAPSDSFAVTPSLREQLEDAGNTWSSNSCCPDFVKTLWNDLLRFQDKPVCNFDYRHMETGARVPPDWLKLVYCLMVISDIASKGVGFVTELTRKEPTDDSEWVVDVANETLFSTTDANLLEEGKSLRLWQQAPSITTHLISDDVVCVQPKVITSSAGCSMRNLTQNLSFLPPRGKINVCWVLSAREQQKLQDTELNVLLIPFPYVLDDRDFQFSSGEKKHDGNWGWFEVQQTWLNGDPNLITEFVDCLIAKAGKEAPVNGVVFPEYSLKYKDCYESLAEHIKTRHPSVQFLVAGSSENCAGETGNIALSTHFYGGGGEEERVMSTVSRHKHHRWSMSKAQIDTYGLLNGSGYEKGTDKWWEKISIPPRQIHFLPLENGSFYSVMICEDMARTDPVHDPMKAVGPNLVFALLFDGPQFEWRWATRSAIGLSEDPGSSVLTFTCRAMVERWIANQSNLPERDKRMVVGAWKQRNERAREIEIPKGVEAVLLKLKGNSKETASMDGRLDRATMTWAMSEDYVEISLDRGRHKDLLLKMGA